MSLEVAVILFTGEGEAVKRYADARDRSTQPGTLGEAPAWTRDVGFVERHHSGHLLLRGVFAGHYLDVDENDHVSQKGTAEGAVGGAIVGLLGGPPGIAVGFLAGALIGAQHGQPSDAETEPEALAAQLREAIPPSSSAIVMFAPGAEIDEVLGLLGDAAANVVRRVLSSEETASLEASLESAPRAE
jgi:uncharacterized membrane protein